MDKVKEISIEPKRIVKMLYNSRVERGASIPQLCKGVCSASMLEKIEKGSRNIKRNCLNRLLARLGVDQKNYEKYLGPKEYDEWKDKNDIINVIEDGELEKAQELLEKYKVAWVQPKTIEEQFYIFMKAQVLQHEENADNKDKIYALYKEAMDITILKLTDKEKRGTLLSPDELNLVLECKSRELKYDDANDIFEIYRKFINYIDKSHYDQGCKAKIYPKVVIYAYNHLKSNVTNLEKESKKHIYTKLLIICEKAVEILRNNNKSFYLDELFTVYMEVLSYMITIVEDEDKLVEYKDAFQRTEAKLQTYREVCKNYGIESRMLDCCYLYREEDVYCINDVIKKRRKMLNIKASDLYEGICSEKTYRRIESRECSPQEPVMDAVFSRLGLSNEYINLGIATDSKRVVELYEKYRHLVNANELDAAEKVLNLLEKKLPECAVNKQILLRGRSVVQWKKGEKTVKDHIADLEKVLLYTIKLEDLKEKGIKKDLFYSWIEISCIHAMAYALKGNERFIEANEYINILIEYFNLFDEIALNDVYIGLYEMVMQLCANIIGSMGKYDASSKISNRLNILLLKLRRTNLLHLNMYNITWNNKQMGIIPSNVDLEKCINLCQLTQSKHYEECYRTIRDN